MNNLLTKTLFILLLSSAAISSNIQANFSDVAKKIFQITTSKGVLCGATIGGIATLVKIVEQSAKICKRKGGSMLIKTLKKVVLDREILMRRTLAGAVVGGLAEVAKTKIQQFQKIQQCRKEDNL